LPEDPEAEDIEFARSAADKLYSLGTALGINPERWDRVRDEVLFSDVVEEVLGKHGSPINCPFHGRDSTPSFYVYPPARGNCGWCFGCAPDGYYDNVKLVSKTFDIDRVKALVWIEKKWNLPPLQDVPREEEEEEFVEVVFDDLSEAYILQAAKEIQHAKDFELASEYLRIYFQADRDQDPMPLARVVGRETVQRIMRMK